MLRQTYYACALYTYTNLYTQICIDTQIVIQYSQPSTVLKFWKNFERNVHCCTKYLCSIEIFQIPSVQCDVQICISPTSGDKLNMKKVSLVGIAYLKNIRRITPGERPSLETSKSSLYFSGSCISRLSHGLSKGRWL
jgi:hypothetical protein